MLERRLPLAIFRKMPILTGSDGMPRLPSGSSFAGAIPAYQSEMKLSDCGWPGSETSSRQFPKARSRYGERIISQRINTLNQPTGTRRREGFLELERSPCLAESSRMFDLVGDHDKLPKTRAALLSTGQGRQALVPLS